jgi:hypothetical protein
MVRKASMVSMLAKKMKKNLKKQQEKEVLTYKASGAPGRVSKVPVAAGSGKSSKKAAQPDEEPVVRKPHRFRSGTVAYRNALRLQKEYKGRIISHKQYRRLLGAHVLDYHADGIKWQKRAVFVSQYMVEWMTINRTKLATLLSSHCKHTKVGRSDFELADYILREFCGVQ